ncbi:hypothetical protein HMPREF3189_00876 [Clostridiales bacterium KA00134]|nr:hypothetical protein HMPREF3189_00876 [Clostridiales bacterium KA00134]
MIQNLFLKSLAILKRPPSPGGLFPFVIHFLKMIKKRCLNKVVSIIF